MTIIDKKVKTLGERGELMYFTRAQLKQAIAAYPQHTFEQSVAPYSMPRGQSAYRISNLVNAR